MLKKICVLFSRYCILLSVVPTFIILFRSLDQSIGVQYKVRKAAADLRNKLSSLEIGESSLRLGLRLTISESVSHNDSPGSLSPNGGPREPIPRSTLSESLESSLNEIPLAGSPESLSVNDNLRSSSVNESQQPNLNESLWSSLNETKHLIEMLRKKSVITFGGSGYYEGRYKPFRNFTESQIDSIITSFGIPNLNSSSLKDQLLACTGLILAKGKKPVNITNEGNVVMSKHFQRCKNMSFQKTGKATALLSFPGSGNSWVQQLIETTTGIYTGTYKDCDDSYIYNGMIGEGVYTDNVIAVKLHYPNAKDMEWLYERNIIYVVRNPFDAILAEWNRWQSALKNHDTAHISTTNVFGEYDV